MLSVGLSTVLMIAAVILLVLILLSLRVREKARRKAFLTTRTQISDSEFPADLDVASEHRAKCLAARRALAKLIQVPPACVHASGPLQNLIKLGFTLGDFFLKVEDELSAESDIDAICGAVQDSPGVHISSFGDLIVFFLGHPEFFKEESQVVAPALQR